MNYFYVAETNELKEFVNSMKLKKVFPLIIINKLFEILQTLRQKICVSAFHEIDIIIMAHLYDSFAIKFRFFFILTLVELIILLLVKFHI